MMRVIVAIIIISLIVIEVCAKVSNSDAKKKLNGCRSPKASYGQTIREDCSVMECSKLGKWESCGQPTRQDSLEKIEDSVETMKDTMENMKDTMENMKDTMENMMTFIEYGSRPWRIQGPQDIARNNQIARLYYLGKDFKISFDVLIRNLGIYGKNSLQSIIRFMDGLPGSDGFTTKIPGVFFNGGEFVILTEVNGSVSSLLQDAILATPQVDVWYNIYISQTLISGNQYKLEILIAFESVYSVTNTQAVQYQNVKVYSGDPWWPALDGEIRNLWIET